MWFEIVINSMYRFTTINYSNKILNIEHSSNYNEYLIKFKLSMKTMPEWVLFNEYYDWMTHTVFGIIFNNNIF